MFSSEALAEHIRSEEILGRSKVAIVIGITPSESVNEIPNSSIRSISPMKLTDGMLSVVVLEQIYRAYRILNNEPYHK